MMVLGFIAEARQVPLPVTRSSIEAFGAAAKKLLAAAATTDLSSCFGPLEQKAESAGNSEAAHFLRKAKMAFLAAHAAKPTRQADIRMFSES